MGTKDTWKDAQVVDGFFALRESIPYGKDQVKVMLHMIRQLPNEPTSILDLGCGDGITGSFLLSIYPESSGDFVDFSPPMLDKARKRLKDFSNPTRVFEANLESTSLPSIVGEQKYDCIVTSYALHHLTHPRKQKIYQEIFAQLKPGGVFINIEHVASATPEIGRIWDELFIDHIYHYKNNTGETVSRDQVAEEYLNRPDQYDNILAPVELQCQLLRDIGFKNVDIYFKIFDLSVFGGYKR